MFNLIHLHSTLYIFTQASWASAMMVCFAGALLVNPLCGESPLEFLEDPLRIGIATLLWYLMFYSPKDVVYGISKSLAVKTPLYVIKGLYYPKKILGGIKHAKHVFSKNNILAVILIATLKSNGSGFIKPFARFARGATENLSGCLETMKPSVTTKYCLICSILYTMMPGDLSYIIITGLLVTMKAGPLFNVPVDGFSLVETKVAPILFRNIEAEKKDE